MKTVFHAASKRGVANFGWLNSYHSFSFGRYYNPEKTNFGALRVLNDDIVKGGKGFGHHPHDNMEIISIPLRGELKHEDSTGRGEIIHTGDVQIMSAGTGIEHSEFNPNESEEVNFLQLWIFPKEKNIKPRYDQKRYDAADRKNKFQWVVSPTHENALWINQDAYLSLADADAKVSLEYNLQQEGNGLYLFVLEGAVKVGEQVVNKRDAIGLSDTSKIMIEVQESSQLLAIEVPMQF